MGHGAGGGAGGVEVGGADDVIVAARRGGSGDRRRPGRARGRSIALAVGLAVTLMASCSSAGEGGSPEVVIESTDITQPVTGEPQRGGRVVYGTEAEVDGFNPVSNRWAIAGHTVAQAVYDPLTALDADGVAQPYLAESLTPNDDFTTWTIVLRPGVTFHNGTPLTAEAVVANLEAHRVSPLTSTALAPVSSVTARDELTVEVALSQPWVVFPSVLAGQAGYVVEPSMLDPANTEASRNPIGTGPFRFVEWTPNVRWVGERYEGYWREGLPYLDAVEFRPLPNPQQRFNALLTGEVNLVHLATPTVAAEMRAAAEAGEVQFLEDPGEAEESAVLLNLEVEPLNDVRVRRALALATDNQTFNEVINLGLLEPSSGPFSPGTPWHTDAGYPAYDPAAARALIDEYLADPATPDEVRFTLTSTPAAREQAELLAEQWREVGIAVEIETLDQAEFINTAVSGNFEANIWRQFGSPDPDGNFVWWYSTNRGAPNVLNFPNMFDAEVDAALDEGRRVADPTARKAAYDRLQRRLAELVPYVWLAEARWWLGAANDVRGITNGPLPDGAPSYPLAGPVPGSTRLTQTWIATGSAG